MLFRSEAVEGALPDFVEPIFRRTDALIFVGACGIAVRAVAPHLRSKAEDPAVLAVDETARFVVPLVSGHIGGANRLARLLARDLEAEPVVTTATDVNAKFSVDAWAAEQGLHINRLDAAKAVSAAILEGPVPLKSDFPIAGELPPGEPLLLVVESDIAKALGQAVAGELGNCRPVVALDSIQVEQNDYIDIGKPLMDGLVVPVVVKTLIFG